MKFWSSPAELGSVVSRSIINLIKSNPAVGWVRGDAAQDDAVYKEIERLKAQNDLLKLGSRASADTGEEKKRAFKHGPDIFDVLCEINFLDPATNEPVNWDWIADPSVDELFGAIAPILLDAANDMQLKETLDDFLFRRELKDIKKDRKLKNFELERFSLQDAAYQTTKIQLLALELIVKGIRPVGGATAYILTEQGERQMFKIKAVTRLPAP